MTTPDTLMDLIRQMFPPNLIQVFLFVCLCICVFVYLCICVFVYLCIDEPNLPDFPGKPHPYKPNKLFTRHTLTDQTPYMYGIHCIRKTHPDRRQTACLRQDNCSHQTKQVTVYTRRVDRPDNQMNWKSLSV